MARALPQNARGAEREDLITRYLVFMTGIVELRVADYDISDSEAAKLFFDSMAAFEHLERFIMKHRRN